ncbi:MAG TPA: hypothetical protein VGK14_11170 [Novimethylophilus sp.]|jgi:hypothetical protein|uniref:hypothetical protein n=1 Tax=Novimethylophilus sp. TaxID=2137426 RepID=UPI002F3F29C2
MRGVVAAMLALGLLAGCASSPSSHDNPSKIDRITPEQLDRLLPQPAPHLSLDDIVALSGSGEAPEAIIARIRDTHSSYALTPAQIVELNRKGVSTRVLDHIYNAQQQAIRDGMADELNQRERKQREEIQRLQRELQRRPYYSDPWPYPPYWYGYPYPRPYWRW